MRGLHGAILYRMMHRILRIGYFMLFEDGTYYGIACGGRPYIH